MNADERRCKYSLFACIGVHLRFLFVFLCVLCVLCGSSSAAELQIAQDGKSDYSIVVPPHSSPAMKLAADEIQKYVEQMSGVKLPVRSGEIERGKPVIYIAMSPHSSHAVVRADEATILIACNSPDGVLNAAYRFLDLLGCRFLAPHFDHYNGAAEVIPKQKTLTLKLDSTIESDPKLKFRKLYVEEGHSHDIQNLKQLAEWTPKVGYNTLVIPTDYQGSGRVRWDNWRKELTPELQKRGITIEVGGHGYQNFLGAELAGGKYFAEHPEWFAKSAAGKPQKAKQWVFCTSNADAVKQLTTNFLAYIKDRPEIQIFDFWPPDGARWCECDACKKLGEPPDRQAILLKQVQDAVQPVRPDLRLEVIAYSSYLQPPKNVAVDKNVLVDFCPISQHFDAQINDPDNKNKTYADALQAWRKQFAGDISIYSYYRKYAWDSLPVIIPRYMQKDLQWYATLPTQGVSVYSEPGDWFTYELNHYVLAALAWDENVDVDALVQKFCAARYGDEAGVAKKTLDALERIVRVYCSVPHVPLKDPGAIAKAQAEVKMLVGDVSSARARAMDENVKRSLERLGLMCTYALRDLEIQHLRATKAPREQVVEQAKSLHAWVKSHADDGVFLIRGNRLNQNRMLTRYGVGEPRKTPAMPE
jgi:hypothetical protein